MSLQSLYPLTGTMMLVGSVVILYGLSEFSPILLLEGVFLVWLGFSITANVWELNRLDT